jgi:hypothetical protein
MIMATQKLEEEEVLGRMVTGRPDYPKLRDVMEDTVISEHRALMQNLSIPFLQREITADLARIYMLLKRVDGGLEPVLITLEGFVEAEATKGVETLGFETRRTGLTPKDYMEYVDFVTANHSRFSEVVQGPFAGDPRFVVSLDKACRAVINRESKAMPLSIPDLLAKFVDSCLKKSTKAGSDEEIEEKQIKAIFVFKYIDDKDMFQKIYSKLLAKRLIHGNSVSEEAEASMISKLKQRCGYEYTVKLQKMFTDISLSTNLNDRFAQTEVGGGLSFNLKMLVLQSGAWPVGTTATSPLTLPTELDRCINLFSKFYENMHSGRKLNWLHHLSTADMKARLGKSSSPKVFEFSMTAFQMAVMLLYNNSDSEEPPVHTVGAIREATSLSDKELQRTLRSLLASNLLKSTLPDDSEGGNAAGGDGGGENDEGEMGVTRSASAPDMETELSSGDTGSVTPTPSTSSVVVPPASPSSKPLRRSSSASSALTAGAAPLDDDCEIELNVGYSNKKKKIKLTGAVQRETPQESKQLRESLNEDRKFFLQAVAVRVMKTRKSLSHTLLVKEIIGQAVVRFKPTVVAIKRCIEELIEKQYLERSLENKHMLLYIA